MITPKGYGAWATPGSGLYGPFVTLAGLLIAAVAGFHWAIGQSPTQGISGSSWSTPRWSSPCW